MACLIDDCTSPIGGGAKGLCGKHYRRLRVYGDPLGGPPFRAAYGSLTAFVEAAIVSDTDECIVWPFPPCEGYAYLDWRGKRRRAHIVVCEEVHGAKPPDKDVAAHRCGRNLCLNPRHLRWATHAENMADKIEHGTANRGEQSWRAKLTEVQVREIKLALAAKEKHHSIAERYDVSTSAISLISSGRNWAWL